MITVDGVPPSTKRPGTFIRTVFGAGRSAGVGTKRLLLCGQMLTADIVAGSYTVPGGTAAVSTAYTPRGVDDANSLFGRRSELASMYRKAIKAAPSGIRIDCIASPDATNRGVQSLTIATTPTAGGVVHLEIGDEVYDVAYATGDTVTAIATAIVAAIMANLDSRVTATNSAGVVTLASCTKGPRGSQPLLNVSITAGTATTAVLGGSTLTTSGLLAESVANVLTAIYPVRYDLLAFAQVDATNLGLVRDQLDTVAGPMVQRREKAVFASLDTQGNATTLAQGAALDAARDQLLWHYKARQMSGEIAAAWAARRLVKTASDPAVPLVKILVPGITVQRDPADYPSESQVDACLDSGVTPLVPSGDQPGFVEVSRSITTRSLVNGLPNYGVLDTHKVDVPDAISDLLQQQMDIDFEGYKLEPDNGETAPQGVVRPAFIAAYIDAKVRAKEGVWVQTGSVAAHPTRVEIADGNPSMIVFETDLDVIDWLVTKAGSVRQTR